MAVEAINSAAIIELEKKQPHSWKRWALRNLLLFLIIFAVFLGFTVGFAAKQLKPSSWAIWLVEFPGNLMLSMIKLVILPLIVSSLINGIAQLDVRHLGKIGGYAVVYYMLTTMLAVILGISLVMLIKPGNRKLYEQYKSDKQYSGEASGPDVGFVSTTDSILDVIRNLFPENIVQATMQNVKTIKEVTPYTTQIGNVTVLVDKYKLKYVEGTNVLGVIVFSIAFGIVLSQLGEAAHTMIELIATLEKITMKLVSWIVWITPVGVFSLIAGSVLNSSDLGAFLKTIGLFLLTANIGLLLHFFVTLPGVYYLATRKNPIIFLQQTGRAMATAFGTASSSATLPVTLRCLEDGLKIDKRVTRFVLPLGATINMDGLALYESVAAIFIAQMQLEDGNLPAYQVIMISLTAILSSIGAAAVPQGGIVAMVMVLAAVQLPPDDIVIIMTVDWIMDRFQTMVNVIGDAYGACIIAHLCADQLDSPLENIEDTDVINRTVDIYYDGGSGSTASGRDSGGDFQPVAEVPQQILVDPASAEESGTKTMRGSKTAPVSSAMLSY